MISQIDTAFLQRRLSVASYLLLLAVTLTGCGNRVASPLTFTIVPTPKLADGVITLSVAHVINPRLEKFSDAQLEAFLDSMKKAAKIHLGRDIEFAHIETFAIDEFFKTVPSYSTGWRKAFIYDFKRGKGDRTQLEAAYEASLGTQAAPAKDWAAYAAREIGLDKFDTDPTVWKKRFADTHLQRLEAIRTIKAADGRPVIDDSLYNEWMFWNMVGERPDSYDVIITNQLVASAEYGGVDIHSALRGGITVGTTDFSTTSKLGAQLWWSTFPYTSNDPVIVKMRGGETYDPLEAARLSGTGAAHELGHVLFHYGHPFGVPSCLMSPTPMLRFRSSLEKVDPAACAAARDPAMKPDSITVKRPVYSPQLLAQTQKAASQ